MTPKSSDKQFYIFFGIGLYILLLFFGLHLSTVSVLENANSLDVFSLALTHMATKPFQIVITGKTFSTLLIITAIAAFGAFYVYIDGQKNEHNVPGREKGSAKWMSDFDKYNKTYTDPYGSKLHNGEGNMILTQNVFLNMDTRKTLRNNNVLVVGGSGAGKSRYVVKPNLLQMNCNYVVTDPSGELLQTVGGALEKNGYEVKVFNLVEMAKSDQYNPFEYIRDDPGVLMMINCLIKNTNPDGKSGGDPFWEKSETALLQALCFYLNKYCPKNQQNFTSVMKLLRAAEVDENNPQMKSKLDRLFDEVMLKDPNSIAVKQYLTFKMGAGKTLKSILISCSVRLTVFNLKQIENLTKVDTLDLTHMGEGKKALFVVIPSADSTYNFLVSMMYSQLFESLYFMAETKYEGARLPRHIRFLLDEFVNIGQIPEFTKKLATMRKYEISCTVILQNLAQIKSMYKDDWESIVGNCDSFLFLGGQEQGTLEYVSKELGKATINVRNRSMSKGKSSSASHSFNKDGRELLTPDELARIPTTDCVLFIRGLEPVYDKKYDYVKHPRYKETGDADKSQNYVNTRNNNETLSLEKMDEEKQNKHTGESPNGESKSVEEATNIMKRTLPNSPENIKENRTYFGSSIHKQKENKTTIIASSDDANSSVTSSAIKEDDTIPDLNLNKNAIKSKEAKTDDNKIEKNEGKIDKKDSSPKKEEKNAEKEQKKEDNEKKQEKPEKVKREERNKRRITEENSDNSNNNDDGDSNEVWDFKIV